MGLLLSIWTASRLVACRQARSQGAHRSIREVTQSMILQGLRPAGRTVPCTPIVHLSTVRNRNGSIPPDAGRALPEDQKATIPVPLQCVLCPCRAKPSMHAVRLELASMRLPRSQMAIPAGGQIWRQATASTQRPTLKLAAPSTSRPSTYACLGRLSPEPPFAGGELTPADALPACRGAANWSACA